MEPKLLGERRFGTALQLANAIISLLTVFGLEYDDTVYVKVFADYDRESGYPTVIRLWESTLTDGSKVYDLHIL